MILEVITPNVEWYHAKSMTLRRTIFLVLFIILTETVLVLPTTRVVSVRIMNKTRNIVLHGGGEFQEETMNTVVTPIVLMMAWLWYGRDFLTAPSCLWELLPTLPEGNIGRCCPPRCAGKASGCRAGISVSGWDSLPLSCPGNFPKECAYVKADALTSATLGDWVGWAKWTASYFIAGHSSIAIYRRLFKVVRDKVLRGGAWSLER